VQIQQVLLNLIRNAVEAMEGSEHPSLTITADRQDGMIEIAVIDQGSGIPPEIQDNLFQPFVTSKAEGMGIGLSVCRTIIEAHAGRLWPEVNPEGGSIFRFTLPIAGGDCGTAEA
jgi:two-component system sensor kinase FixL